MVYFLSHLRWQLIGLVVAVRDGTPSGLLYPSKLCLISSGCLSSGWAWAARTCSWGGWRGSSSSSSSSSWSPPEGLACAHSGWKGWDFFRSQPNHKDTSMREKYNCLNLRNPEAILRNEWNSLARRIRSIWSSPEVSSWRDCTAKAPSTSMGGWPHYFWLLWDRKVSKKEKNSKNKSG